MTDYNSYRESKGLSNRDMIRVIRAEFSNYSKAQQSMVSNPAKNGVCLLPEAERILEKNFGPGPGLSISDSAPGKKRTHANREKPNRLYVRLSDELSKRVDALMGRMSFASKQDFIEAAIQQMCERYGG